MGDTKSKVDTAELVRSIAEQTKQIYQMLGKLYEDIERSQEIRNVDEYLKKWRVR